MIWSMVSSFLNIQLDFTHNILKVIETTNIFWQSNMYIVPSKWLNAISVAV